MIALTVVREFDGYAKGAKINDPVTVSQILAGHNQRDVLKTWELDPIAQEEIKEMLEYVKPVEDPLTIIVPQKKMKLAVPAESETPLTTEK